MRLRHLRLALYDAVEAGYVVAAIRCLPWMVIGAATAILAWSR